MATTNKKASVSRSRDRLNVRTLRSQALEARRRSKQAKQHAKQAKAQAKEARRLFKEARKVAKRAKAELAVLTKQLRKLMTRSKAQREPARAKTAGKKGPQNSAKSASVLRVPVARERASRVVSSNAAPRRRKPAVIESAVPETASSPEPSPTTTNVQSVSDASGA